MAGGALLTLVAAGAATADNVVPDGDLVTAGNQSTLDLGTLCTGVTLDPSTANMAFTVTRQGNYATARVFQKASTVDVGLAVDTWTGPADSSVSLSPVNPSISIPADWDTAANGTAAGPATAKLSIAAGSSPGAVSLTISVRATGTQADGTSLTRTSSLPVTATIVDCPSTPTDTIAPSSSASAATNGGEYVFGEWANTDVTLTLQGEDDIDGSGLKEIRYTTDGSLPTADHGSIYDAAAKPVIDTDGVHTVRFAAVDNAGNVETPVNAVTVKLDKTNPVITDDSVTTAPAGIPGSNGWWTSDVTVTFAAADGLSGFTDKTDPFTFTRTTSGEGSAVTVSSGTVNDVAGNTSASVDSAPFKVDLTDPGVVCRATPTFVLGSTGQVSADVTDETSLPAAATATAAADTSSVGAKTVSVTGYDNAGRSTTVSCGYDVVYDWTGFFRPVDNLPTLNSVKAGSSVPVKFSLGGDQGLDIMADGYPRSATTTCGSTVPVDAVEETTTAGSSSLSYDPLTGQYNYVWKTDKAWAGECRQLVVLLDDGTTHRASFKLTK